MKQEQIASNQETQSMRVISENNKIALGLFNRFKKDYEKFHFTQGDTIGPISYVKDGQIHHNTFTVGYYSTPEQLVSKIKEYVEKNRGELEGTDVEQRLSDFAGELQKLFSENEFRKENK